MGDSLIQLGVRVFNRLGPRFAGDLTPEGIKKAAADRAGSDNFGDWAIGEPLELLIEAYHREAALTPLGWLAVRETLVSGLANLVGMEKELQANPGIAGQRLGTPVFVIGLPRTGTTLLHALLSQDPGNRTPLSWEVMYPGSYVDDPKGRAAAMRSCARRLGWANRLAPAFKRIHPIAHDLPQECIAITAHVLRSIQFHTTHNVPSYQNWLETDDQRVAYRFHERLLQHLEFGQPGGRWVLKAPGHLFALPALLQRYPDASIIQTHRDPLEVIASMASHATVLRRAFSDQTDPNEIAADWVERWSSALDRFLRARDRHTPHSFHDVHYAELENDPIASVARIYDFLDWPFTVDARQQMSAFLAANPKNKHGAHRYSLDQYGLQRERESERFRDYRERFAIA